MLEMPSANRIRRRWLQIAVPIQGDFFSQNARSTKKTRFNELTVPLD
jgi:hypothetical protein